MIGGIGIDMIEVNRIAESIGKDSGFRELVFSPSEIAYCEKKTNKFEHYAARFAAKEAFYKALGEGWMANTAFSEIEVFHDEKAGDEITGRHGKTSIVHGHTPDPCFPFSS